jgi:hypothetical protein
MQHFHWLQQALLKELCNKQVAPESLQNVSDAMDCRSMTQTRSICGGTAQIKKMKKHGRTFNSTFRSFERRNKLGNLNTILGVETADAQAADMQKEERP